MIEFIESHYVFILVCFSVLIEVLILINSFRKGSLNKKDFIEVIIDQALPGFINLAEESSSDGSSKLALVVKLCIDKIKSFITKKDESFYRSLIVKKVEAILSTPQKKGE